MFLKRTLPARRAIRDTLRPYGLTDNLERRMQWDGRNQHISDNGRWPHDTWAPRQAMDIYIPIEATIRGRVSIAIDRVDGLRPRLVSDTGPVVNTHGASGRFERSLGQGNNIAWLQTVTRVNESESGPHRFAEFVDTGGAGVPFTGNPETRDAPENRVVFEDTPCGSATTAGRSMLWTAILSLAVRHRPRQGVETIIVLAGHKWGFRIVGDSVVILPDGQASRTELENQKRILQIGRNQLGQNTGANLNYLLPPAAHAVIHLD